MTPTLFYTLYTRYGFCEVLEITSVSGSTLYGRRRSKSRTRAPTNECWGRYSDLETAQKRLREFHHNHLPA
jgi:hypothetical protein